MSSIEVFGDRLAHACDAIEVGLIADDVVKAGKRFVQAASGGYEVNEPVPLVYNSELTTTLVDARGVEHNVITQRSFAEFRAKNSPGTDATARASLTWLIAHYGEELGVRSAEEADGHATWGVPVENLNQAMGIIRDASVGSPTGSGRASLNIEPREREAFLDYCYAVLEPSAEC